MAERVLTNVEPALRRGWHPVARSDEVGAGPHRVLLLGEPWVLFHDGTQMRAFIDRCPHRLAPLSLGQCIGDTLQCGYHGWRFASDGRCVAIPSLGAGSAFPARAYLTPAARVEERYGLVFLAPDEPLVPLTEIPEAENGRFQFGELTPIRARASVGLLADNFLDMAHFPFVHGGTFGSDEAAEVPNYSVDRRGLSFSVSYEHIFANREDPAVATGERPLMQARRLTYQLDAPFQLTLRIDFLESGGTNLIGFFLQPETEDRCRVYTTLWRDDLGGDAQRMADAVDYELAAVREDLLIQEAFDRLVLPLDPALEVHTRADRITLELRRVISDLMAGYDEVPNGPVGSRPREVPGGR
jgi:phenylpropionate dioxygenase-like ring-hydroxylating dioxygenase large terminal subunit